MFWSTRFINSDVVKVRYVVFTKRSWVAFCGVALPCSLFLGCSAGSGEVVIPDKGPGVIEAMDVGPNGEDVGVKPATDVQL